MSTETHPFQCQAKTHPAGKCEAVGILKKNPHQSIHSSLLFNHQAKLDFTSNTELTAALEKEKLSSILLAVELYSVSSEHSGAHLSSSFILS